MVKKKQSKEEVLQTSLSKNISLKKQSKEAVMLL